MPVTLTFDGWDDLETALEELAARVESATETAVKLGGEIVRAEVLTHMNGRPGPNVITGTLRRSVKVGTPIPERTGVWSVTVAPTVVYARRIELGFEGTDSLGRVYPKKYPYPYMAPGLTAAVARLGTVLFTQWSTALEV
jgi:hypothetical protein